MALMSNY